MRFKDIIGHEDVKERLRNLADGNRIPHAILLEGPEGVGKHALARAFLQYVGCRNRADGDSCGQCPSCRQHETLQHIDTIFSFPYVKRKNEDKSKPTLANDYLPDFIEFMKSSPYMDQTEWLRYLDNPNTKPIIYVHEANELIRRLSFAPNITPYNALILWQADRLKDDAANKLLKIIEEPPGQAIIIMTSNSPLEILPTIYSRTQRIKVGRLSDSEVASWMLTRDGVDTESAAVLAPLARGSILEAQRILAKRDDSIRFLEMFISLMRLAYKRDIAALKEWSEKVAGEKREVIVDFLEYTAAMIRENFVANLRNASLNLMTPAESDFSRNFARFINERNVERLFEATNVAITDIRGNVSPKIVLFDYAITVILTLKQ